MTWRARFSVGGPVGLLVIGPILALDIWLLNGLLSSSIPSQEIDFFTFAMGLIALLSVPFLLILLYQTLSWATLRYHLDRNGVTVRWFGSEQIVPIRNIQRIIQGHELGDTVVRRRGLHWPGHERGTGMVPGIGRTHFLATRPLSEQLLLITPGCAYGISPHDPEEFLSGFEARRELGPNRLLEQEIHRDRWLTLPLWTDQTAWILMSVALVVNVGLFGYLCTRFPGLDFNLPLHFDRLGQPDRPGTKMELFALPIIGLIILTTNVALGLALYRRERAGSYLLWGAAAVVQALFWLAAFSIIP
jgi:hypothetical protein